MVAKSPRAVALLVLVLAGCGDKRHEGSIRVSVSPDAQWYYSADNPGGVFLVVGDGSPAEAGSDLSWQGHIGVLCDAVVEDVSQEVEVRLHKAIVSQAAGRVGGG